MHYVKTQNPKCKIQNSKNTEGSYFVKFCYLAAYFFNF